MNQLFESEGNQTDQSEFIFTQLEQVNAYAKFHFNHEETLFKKYKYANESAHLLLHREWEQELLQYIIDAATGKIPQASVLLKDMEEWLHNHICVEDKKYVEFFKSKGVL